MRSAQRATAAGIAARGSNESRPSATVNIWPASGKTGCCAWRAFANPSSVVSWSPSKAVSERYATVVVEAREDDRVPGEVGRLAVVVEVVEVAEQKRGPALLHRYSRRLPALLGAFEGLEHQRGAGELDELLLQPRGPPVGEPRRRGAVHRHEVEAGAGPQAEGHVLGHLEAVVGEQVAKRGRAAVVAGHVPVARHHGRLAHAGDSTNRGASSTPSGPRTTRASRS